MERKVRVHARSVDGLDGVKQYNYTYEGSTHVGRTYKAICMYHGGCADGVGAAYVIHEHMTIMAREYGHAEALYVPMQYSTRYKQISQLRDAGLLSGEVFVVDFSITYENAISLLDNGVNFITVIDHHKSVAEELEKLRRLNEVTVVYASENERSGAVLTYEYFFGDLKVPHALLAIEDRDLWKFNYPDTKAFVSGLFSHGLSIETVEMACHANGFEQLVSDGEAIERAKAVNIDQSLGADMYSVIEVRPPLSESHSATHYKVGLVNIPFYLASDTGHTLLERRPDLDFVLLYNFNANEVRCSLRARKGGVDVSEFAAFLGGGGHKEAAGFTMNGDDFYAMFLA